MRYLIVGLLALAITGCASNRMPAPRSDAPEKTDEAPENTDEVRPAPPASAERSLAEADKLFAGNRYDDARKVYQQTAKEALAEGNNSLRTEALAQVARMHSILGDYVKGRQWLEDARQIATDAEPMGWSRYLGVRGRFEWQDEKDKPKATATFIEMYEYSKSHELHGRALDAAHMVAIVGTPQEQVRWSLNAIEEAEKAGETGWLGPLWNNLGWTYEERGEYANMLEALLKAREYHYKSGNEHTQLVADFGVARAYWRNDNNIKAREWLDDAFTRAKKRHEAKPEDTEKGEWVGWGHIYFADILDSEGEKAEALENYKAGRPFLVAAGIENWWPEQLQKLDAKIAELEADGE